MARFICLTIMIFHICIFWSMPARPNNFVNPIQFEVIKGHYSDEAIIALKVSIANGWKVFSNDPGDSGLPFTINLDGTDNISEYRIEWPDSEIYNEYIDNETLISNIYTKSALIPIHIVPKDKNREINLQISAEYTACNAKCLQLEQTLNDIITPGFVSTSNLEIIQKSVNKMHSHLYIIILFAIIGGLILNAMPCVLPVLSLKLLGLINYSGLSRKEIRINLLSTVAGIFFSFLCLAFFTILTKNLGHHIGWGMHFQEPVFISCLIIILIVFSSNLWGDFEINLPYWLNSRLSSNYNSASYVHSFSYGAFATLLATPCTAPFLTTSVAFALSQSNTFIIMIYTAIGFGMALPFVALTFLPQALHLIPKPGHWMLKLKKLFALLLILSAVWLIYVLSFQMPVKSIAAFLCSLLALKFALVNYNLVKYPKLKFFIIIASIAAALTFPYQVKYQEIKRQEKIDNLWTPFTEDVLQEALKNSKIVLVDVTAEWCIICKVNKFTVLEQEEVMQILLKHNVVMLRADFTNHSQEISEFLEKHHRYGIPFNIVYGPGAKEGIALPEILTKTSVIQAIHAAK